MRIETTLIRPGGSTVEMADGTKYHFAPTDTDSRHTAQVTRNDHVKRLLAIDGYQLPDDALDPADPVGKPAPDPETAGNPAGTDALTDAADAPNSLSLAPAPQPVAAATGQQANEPDEDDDPLIEEEPVTPQPGAEAAGLGAIDAAPVPDLETLSDAELQALFKEKFQRAPHPKASREKVIERLAEHDSGIRSGDAGQSQPET
jgi:hypothetical protein